MSSFRRNAAIGATIAVALAVTVLLLERGDDPSARDPAPVAQAPAVAADAPNLLVVMTDDQTVSTWNRRTMPGTRRFFGAGGTTFEQAVAAPPLCCPSRAGFLTGRYAHNTGVVENREGYRTLIDPEATFPVALQASGYRTAMIGKFLNGYEPEAGAEPAPGFDRWFSIFGYADYRDFQVSDNGEPGTESGYATDVLTEQAVEFVRTVHEADDPFFLWLSYNAPHTVLPAYGKPCNGLAAQPRDPGDFEHFADDSLPRPGSFDAASGAPSLRGTKRLSEGDLRATTRAFRCAEASLVAVDEGFSRLVGELEMLGELDDTVVVYLSDNGLYYGEHRLTDDKRLPLEPALRVPMAIRVGGGDGPARTGALVSQVDLAPTLLDYAGAGACPQGRCPAVDGRSLRPLLEGAGRSAPGRAIPLKLDDGWTYEAIRTPRYLYMELEASRKREYGSPKPELYDLRRDPRQLQSVAGAAAYEAAERRLAKRLRAAMRCRGTEGPRAC